MTTILVPPDLEARLIEEAQRRGTTPELLALDGLRQLFSPPAGAHGPEGPTLFDYLSGYVGSVAGSDARKEWLELADVRMAEVRAGKVVGIPADDVLKNLLEPKR